MKPIPAVVLIFFSITLNAQENYHEVMMQDNGANSYYVSANVSGAGQTSLLVDTGAGYSIISEETLLRIQETGNATYIKKLDGVMADGSRKKVSVYKISSLNIGGNCHVRDIEVAVFPNRNQEILGLSTLSKVSPFIFSTNPPRLFLNNCNKT